jgi:hypothetical protein
VSNRPIRYAALLRRELIARNDSYAQLHQLPHVTSYGETAVTVYQASQVDQKHGNLSQPVTERFFVGPNGNVASTRSTAKVIARCRKGIAFGENSTPR